MGFQNVKALKGMLKCHKHSKVQATQNTAVEQTSSVAVSQLQKCDTSTLKANFFTSIDQLENGIYEFRLLKPHLPKPFNNQIQSENMKWNVFLQTLFSTSSDIDE